MTTTARTRTTFSRWLAFALLVALAAVGSACNIVAPAAYIVHGLEKTPAVYPLPDRPTVIFVDDRRNVIAGRVSLRRVIADTASERLMTEKVVTRTISPRDVIAIAQKQDEAGKPLAMDELGRQAGAEQMIYVEMESFALSSDGVTPKPQASCAVRVIDITGRTRLFPPPGAMPGAYPLMVSNETASDSVITSAARRDLEEKLARQLGDALAKIFYKHVEDDVGTRLNPE
jgi:hypothetical protein